MLEGNGPLISILVCVITTYKSTMSVRFTMQEGLKQASSRAWGSQVGGLEASRQEGLGSADRRARGRQAGGLRAGRQEGFGQAARGAWGKQARGLGVGKHTLRVAARRCMVSGSSSSRVSLSNLPRLLMWPYSASSRCCSALFT